MARALATTVLVVVLAAGLHPGAHAAAHMACRSKTADELMKDLRTAAGCPKDAKQSGCKCLGTNGATQSECPKSDVTQWASDGKKCVKVKSDKDKDWNRHTWSYAADYGASCKVHSEPGSYDCTKVKGKEAEHKFMKGNAAYNDKLDSAGWCTETWCYVDPCTCDKTDISKSSWFQPRQLYYSNVQCGKKGSFSAALCTSGATETKCNELASCMWATKPKAAAPAPATPAPATPAPAPADVAGAWSKATPVTGLGLVLVASMLLQ